MMKICLYPFQAVRRGLTRTHEVFVTSMLGLLLLLPGRASAQAKDLNDALGNGAKVFRALAEFAAMGFAAAAVIMVGMGIWKLINHKTRNEPASEGLKMVLGGAFLAIPAIIIAVVVGTFTGSGDVATKSLNKIGL